MHTLMQAPAQGHVDLLQAAADCQHRQSACQRLRDQPKGGGIARRVVRVAFPTGRIAAVMRLHIDERTGQQQPVQVLQPRACIQCRLQAGQQHRHRSGGLGHRADVLLAGGQERPRPLQHMIGRQADQCNDSHAQESYAVG